MIILVLFFLFAFLVFTLTEVDIHTHYTDIIWCDYACFFPFGAYEQNRNTSICEAKDIIETLSRHM